MCREAVLKEHRNGASIRSWLGDSQLERYSVVSFPGTCYVQVQLAEYGSGYGSARVAPGSAHARVLVPAPQQLPTMSSSRV